MHLLSCEHPKRVFNKYRNEYFWVPCRECPTCMNRRAKYFTDACERERSNSLYTMFVTLTYKETALPVYNFTGGFEVVEDVPLKYQGYLLSTRMQDNIPLEINKDDLFDDDADRELFNYFLKNKGIPYASKSDIQLFHKRLNKWFFDNVTHKYQNFRYFTVSELGSTTLRPHFHGLYFINDPKVAERFNEAVLACWKYGIISSEFVESSACSYVSQYINKLSDLPSFYKARAIRPFYVASRNPFVGAFGKFAQSDDEIFDKCLVQTFSQRKKDVKPVLSELDSSTENRLFPRCPHFSEVSDSLRTELYTISGRIKGKKYAEFRENVRKWLNCLSCKGCSFGIKYSEFSSYLEAMVDGFSDTGDNWLRRIYYLSRRFLSNAKRFGVSAFAYLRKIDDYYNKKAQYLLKLFYNFQQEYVKERNNCVDDLQLLYLEYLHTNGVYLGDVLNDFTPDDVSNQRYDNAKIFYRNKQTHFKNMYLETLSLKNNHFVQQLKKFFYAKKRYEISEAFAS